MKQLNAFKKKFDYLNSIGASVSYYKTANKVLHNNLTLLDLAIERIVAESLICYYSGSGRTISEITNLVSNLIDFLITHLIYYHCKIV